MNDCCCITDPNGKLCLACMLDGHDKCPKRGQKKIYTTTKKQTLP